MNKRETVWLIVRLIGLYLGYCAIVTLFSLVASIYAFIAAKPSADTLQPNGIESNRMAPGIPSVNMPPAARSEASSVADPIAEKARSEAFKSILFYLFLTLLYGGPAFYLITRGSVLFTLLAREAGTQTQREETVTTLKL